jgi:hypothetical protein
MNTSAIGDLVGYSGRVSPLVITRVRASQAPNPEVDCSAALGGCSVVIRRKGGEYRFNIPGKNLIALACRREKLEFPT